MVPETQDLIALGLEITGSDSILLSALRMTCAIDLDDQLARKTEEIRDIGTMGHLAAEFHGRKLFTQSTPETFFSLRGVTAENAGPIHGP